MERVSALSVDCRKRLCGASQNRAFLHGKTSTWTLKGAETSRKSRRSELLLLWAVYRLSARASRCSLRPRTNFHWLAGSERSLVMTSCTSSRSLIFFLLSTHSLHTASRPKLQWFEYLSDIAARWYLTILECEHEDLPGALLGRVVYIPSSTSGMEYLRRGEVQIHPMPRLGVREYVPELFPLWLVTLERCRKHLQLKTVYISHPERASIQLDFARRQPHKTIDLRLRRKTRDVLHSQGYTAELRGPDEGHPTTHLLTFSCDDHTITVEYQHTLTAGGRVLEMKASAKMSRYSLDLAGEIPAEPSYVKWWNWAAFGWDTSLDTNDVTFTLPLTRLALKLGLDWMRPSVYFLRIEIVTETLASEIPRLRPG